MYHTMAYTLLIGTTVDTDVPAVQDDIIAIQNSHFILPSPMKLFGACVTSPTFLSGKLVSPTIRQINPILIRPGNPRAIGGDNTGVYYAQGGGAQLYPFEETQILGTAAPGTTERYTALLFAGDQPGQIPVGNIFPVGWTSAVAANANAWTTVAYGLSTVIPSGMYTMILSEHWSTNAIGHRWVFSNQVWRPGFPSLVAATNRLPDHLVANWFGTMGIFRSNDLPRLQVLCNAADAVHTGTMWLMRTGNLN